MIIKITIKSCNMLYFSNIEVPTRCTCYRVYFSNSFIDTNLIHNFLYKLHKIKFLYMFRASSAHLQGVNDVNCTCMQPLVFSFCNPACFVEPDGRILFVQFYFDLLVMEYLFCLFYQRLHTCTINIIDLLKMSGWRSKHVEELNFM